jgi:hypothetical protein
MARAVITPESEPSVLHAVWRAAWWPIVHAIAATGTDCTVLCPDWEDTTFHEGPGYGVVYVRSHTALGWTVVVSECETDQADDE